MILCVMIRPARQCNAHFLIDSALESLTEKRSAFPMCSLSDSPHFASLIRLSSPSDCNASIPAYGIANKVSRLPESINEAQYDRNPGLGAFHSRE